jgi:hypothetical protein
MLSFKCNERPVTGVSFVKFKKKRPIVDFFRSLKRFRPPSLPDKLDIKMMGLVEMLKSKNREKRAKAEFELKRNRERAKPYVRKLLQERNLDPEVRASVIGILGNPDMISNPPLK